MEIGRKLNCVLFYLINHSTLTARQALCITSSMIGLFEHIVKIYITGLSAFARLVVPQTEQNGGEEGARPGEPMS